MQRHEFGGDWTTEKLQCLRKYLEAYTQIFASNVGAQYYSTVYVDAFAGTGYRSEPRQDTAQMALFPEMAEPDANAFLKGSARIALEVEPAFGSYVFIEKDPARAQELAKLKQDFKEKASRIAVIQGEANSYLAHWCTETDWSHMRAVMFLDPYGMQVEWSLIETIARTKGIDLWLLFPLGVAVNRLLIKDRPPSGTWADRLTAMFGTSTWKDAFYPRRTETTLFGEEQVQSKEADFATIGRFFVQRLATVFAGVADTPLALYNSRNVPLYLLCFAAGNPRGAKTAIRIAQDIIEGIGGPGHQPGPSQLSMF